MSLSGGKKLISEFSGEAFVNHRKKAAQNVSVLASGITLIAIAGIHPPIAAMPILFIMPPVPYIGKLVKQNSR